ncbi:MAG TPA: hypothetical protein VGV64_04655 [Thermoplasmata archaeon]|nr:hypothetical protein [Thermoplasmata archaeon]
MRPAGTTGRPEAPVERCSACGKRTIHQGKTGVRECPNCGAVFWSPFEEAAARVDETASPCRWCVSGTTRLASETGRSRDGSWRVYKCDSCGATHVAYRKSVDA